MTQERLTAEEIGDRGEEWYENHIRPIVETEDNIGKLIVVDAETGDYDIDIDANSMDLWKRMQSKHPDARLVRYRIGYPAVHAFGGFRLMPSKR